MSRFEVQFRCLTGRDDVIPFPWQVRLWQHLRRGEVPTAVDVPTGLGKTSVLACWLLAHSGRATEAPGLLPRRLVYVVDRRAVVDQASGEAETLASNWEKVAGAGALGLRLGTLRGQHIDSGAWLDAPGDLAIVVGTVDMIGSRLLFSGYGVSPGMRPVHAGLLGTDTLLVLDEAHLAPSFAAMIQSLAGDPTLHGTFRPPAAPFSVMALSATQRAGEVVEDAARPTVIRLRFDWRRDYVPLDAGFSPNRHGAVTMVGYPVVELLAAIGLRHARPHRETRLSYRYAAWGMPLPMPLARAALGCPDPIFPGLPLRRFHMTLGWPGQEGQAKCIIRVDEETPT